MKALFALIIIMPSGQEYQWRTNLDNYSCHVAYLRERNAAIDLIEQGYDFGLKFECRPQ